MYGCLKIFAVVWSQNENCVLQMVFNSLDVTCLKRFYSWMLRSIKPYILARSNFYLFVAIDWMAVPFLEPNVKGLGLFLDSKPFLLPIISKVNRSLGYTRCDGCIFQSLKTFLSCLTVLWLDLYLSTTIVYGLLIIPRTPAGLGQCKRISWNFCVSNNIFNENKNISTWFHFGS